MPADLDAPFVEIANEFDFAWPEGLAVERVRAGMPAILVAAFVFAGLVVLALADRPLRQNGEWEQAV